MQIYLKNDLLSAGNDPKRAKVIPGSNTPGLKSMPDITDEDVTPYCLIGKRSSAQLRHDMNVTKYLIKSSLPWNHVKSDGWIDFCRGTELRKYHIKNPTTYSKAKLPLLFQQVKSAVDNKIKKDMPGTLGFAFTSDLWSSRYNTIFNIIIWVFFYTKLHTCQIFHIAFEYFTLHSMDFSILKHIGP